MKLLRVRASRFKNCCDDFMIDLVPKSRKTAEDKEYELNEIAPGLFVYATMAFIGKNASGKTTAIELLDCCYSILGEFRLESKHFSVDGTEIEITFYHDGMLYIYTAKLSSADTLGKQIFFKDERIFRKQYFKTNLNEIYDRATYTEMTGLGSLPEDTSKIFFILKKKTTYAVFFDSYGGGPDAFTLLFDALKKYNIGENVLAGIISVFDGNIRELTKLDERNYLVVTGDGEFIMPDLKLAYFFSSGTTKGMLLYTLMAASLREGFNLLIDEAENHFHKTLVENMLSLYRDKTVNRHGASIIFSTHYIETLDQMGRQDNIWVCHADGRVRLSNMYDDYRIRPQLLKSKQYYANAFDTAVDYDRLMKLKKILKAESAAGRKSGKPLSDRSV